MGDSKIEWTDATWNPTRGCTRVSAGCMNCYAERQAHRFSGPGQPYEGLTKLVGGEPRWTGKVRLVPEKLTEPLRWRKPRRVFVDSMSDLFHPDVLVKEIVRVFAVMALCPQHVFQVLTKRPGRMATWAEWNATGARVFHVANEMGTPRSGVWPLPNVWLGTSVEDQASADERIPHLLRTPAAVRFLSCEPLLGPIDLTEALTDGVPTREQVVDNLDDMQALRYIRHGVPRVEWVIVGGESGPGARPCDIEWIRSIVRQCREAGVPCFVKQLGARSVGWHVFPACFHMAPHDPIRFQDRKGGDAAEWPAGLRVREWPVE